MSQSCKNCGSSGHPVIKMIGNGASGISSSDESWVCTVCLKTRYL
ncbi:MAG: hypothetical protein ABID61_02050 [Candidatus Micrarchaeota archaeon]